MRKSKVSLITVLFFFSSLIYANEDITLNNPDTEEISQSIEKKLTPHSYQSLRYFAMSSGYGLKKDESYYQNIMLFYNQFGYGISDYFSFSGGISPMLIPLWITPKFSIPLIENKLNLGLGVVVSYVFNSFIGNDVLLAPYGVATFGSRNNNISLGFGRVIFSINFLLICWLTIF